MRRLLAALVGCALCADLSSPAAASAADPQPLKVDVLEKGSSSLLGIRKAKAAVPVDRMHGSAQSEVKKVLKNLSIYRRLPNIRCETDPRIVSYFLDNPEVAVGIWRVLGVSDVKMTRTSPHTFAADDGQGSRGNLTVVYRDSRQHVLFCDGVFLNPMNKKPIQARAVIHFRHQPEQMQDGRKFSRHDATMFVSLPSNTVEAVARAISPVSNKLADRNFEEVSLFIRMMNVAMADQPAWVKDLSTRLTDVTDEGRSSLVQLASTVHVEASSRYAGRPPLQTAGRPGMQTR